MNERLVKYNKLVAELRGNILRATTVPSIMIAGGSNFPAAKKRKEVERIHSKESELYSDNGKHARFLENTRKMFDPVLKKQAKDIEEMRKKRSEETCALRWSPKNVRWQRILTQNAINSLQHNLKTSVGIEIEVN